MAALSDCPIDGSAYADELMFGKEWCLHALRHSAGVEADALRTVRWYCGTYELDTASEIRHCEWARVPCPDGGDVVAVAPHCTVPSHSHDYDEYGTVLAGSLTLFYWDDTASERMGGMEHMLHAGVSRRVWCQWTQPQCHHTTMSPNGQWIMAAGNIHGMCAGSRGCVYRVDSHAPHATKPEPHDRHTLWVQTDLALFHLPSQG